MSASTPVQATKKEIPTRFTRTTGDYYKGENNLKKLDTPSYLRRDLNVRREEEQQMEQPQQSEQPTNVAPFRQSTERIQKGDTDQPAFLRKIMD